MDEVLLRRLLGTAVLLAFVFLVASLLPNPGSTGADTGAPPTVRMNLRVKAEPTQPLSKHPVKALTSTSPSAHHKTTDKPVDKVAPVHPGQIRTTAPKATREAVTKTAPSPPAKHEPPVRAAGWLVQAASFSDRDHAQRAAPRIGALGFSARVRRAWVNKRVRYRVEVGPFATREAAERARRQVASRGFTGAFVVAAGR